MSKDLSEPSFLPYGRQSIDDDDIDAVIRVLKSDFLTTGPTVQEFEQALCKVTGAKEAIACSNGTVALHLSCMAIGLGPGDLAIVPSLTFLATANAVRYCGADVIFADVDPQTGLMTAATFQRALEKAQERPVKAVLPVHLTGQTVDLKSIRSVADQHGVKVIVDGCHAIGSSYAGEAVGNCHFEDVATFSFHPVKTIAMGEGGAVTLNDPELAKKLRVLRHHGMVGELEKGPWCHSMPELGYNYRLTDMQCALGVSQLRKLDHFVVRRKALALKYDELLKPLSPVIKPPHRVESCDPAWHLYAVRVDFSALGMGRAELMGALREQGIGTQVHYIPVHTQPYYVGLYGEQDLPGAMHYYESTLSLPLFPDMTQDDVVRVVKALSHIMERS